MGEQLSLLGVPLTRTSAARPRAPRRLCGEAPQRPDGSAWALGARACSLVLGHVGAHENDRGDMWRTGDVLVPCGECLGYGLTLGAASTCEACEGTGREEEVCGG